MRSTIKKDLWGFCLPAFLVFTAGLIVCAIDFSKGLTATAGHPDYLNLFTIWSLAGSILYATGLTVSLLAVFTLKRFYSSTLLTREDHQLITHGIYRLTRHPVYLGTLMCMMGIPVFTQSLRGFLVMLVMVPIFLYRIRMEEKMLTREFGDQYRAYVKSTKKLIPFIYVLAVMLFSLSACGSGEVDLLIIDAALFDSRTGTVTPGMAVSIDNGVIMSIGSSVELEGVSASRVIDAGGRLVTPGFIDTHGHLIDVLATSFSDGGGGITELSMDRDSISAYREKFSDAYMPHGVTVVRDAGTNYEYLSLMKDWMVREDSSPDFYPCGGALVTLDERRDTYSGHAAVQDQFYAAATVQEYHDAGFHYIKLYWRLREPEFRAALDKSLELGMVPFAHIDRGVFTIDAALEVGLLHYEHAYTLGVEVLGGRRNEEIILESISEILGGDRRGAWFMATLEGFNRIGEDNEDMLALIGKLASAGATVTPTIHVMARPLGITCLDPDPTGVFDDTSHWTPEHLERARRGYGIMTSYVLAMYDAGVKLAVGTDSVDPGIAVLSELLLLNEAGIPMADVLRIGTLGSAEVIELSALYGTIEDGRRADLIIFDNSPLEDARALLGKKTVVKDGAVWE